jgi:hypothetical protein
MAALALVFGAVFVAVRTLHVPGYVAFGPVIALPACAMVVPMVRSYRRGQVEEEEAATAAPVPPPAGPGASTGEGLPPSPYRR